MEWVGAAAGNPKTNNKSRCSGHKIYTATTVIVNNNMEAWVVFVDIVGKVL